MNDSSKNQYQIWIVDPNMHANPVDGGVFDIVTTESPTIIPINPKLPIGKAKGFAITLEQEYPSPSTEIKILQNYGRGTGACEDNEFCKRLVDWAQVIRKTFYDGGIDEVISTRRLVHILKAYAIFGSKENALKYSINRFDDETKQAFLDLYDKIYIDFNKEVDQSANV